jgi:hypothetical protein
LIVKNTLVLLWSFQGARGPASAQHEKAGPGGRSLKTQQRSTSRSTFDLGEPAIRTAEAIDGAGASGVHELRDP